MEHLNDLYFSRGCCNPFGEDLEGVPNLNDGEDYFSEWFSMDDALAFVKNVYEGKYKEDSSIDKKRVNQYSSALNTAVDKGWAKGGGKASIDFDSPDTKMLNALRDNVFHFSAAKNRSEIVQLSALLRDSKGKLRDWNSFAHEAAKVTNDFQKRYMKVEYDTAVNSAYLAARWQEFDDDDILIFRTARDARVRDAHKKLEGTALPKKHKFWLTFYPPLDWNCRCTVEPSTRKGQTPEDQIPYEEIDNVRPIFRSNFALEGMAFPPNHPYFKNLPTDFVKVGKEEAKKSRNEVREFWNDKIEKGKTLIAPVKAKHIDQITLTRSHIKTMLSKGHSQYIAKNEAIKNILELINNSKYVGWAGDEIINGVQKHPFVSHWQYYEVIIEGKPSYICVQKTHNGEYKPYSIEELEEFKKIKGVKKQSPKK